MSAVKLLYVICHAPYSNAAGQEALDAIFVGTSFEQLISVLFIHDGVFQIKTNQSVQESEYSLKQFTKSYRALSDFGVENIYAADSSLNVRALQANDLIISPTILDDVGVNELINVQDKVFTF